MTKKILKYSLVLSGLIAFITLPFSKYVDNTYWSTIVILTCCIINIIICISELITLIFQFINNNIEIKIRSFCLYGILWWIPFICNFLNK